MIKKIKTLFWYLRRPSVYPQLLHVLKLFCSGKLHAKSVDANAVRDWCCSQAVDSVSAIQQLSGEAVLRDPAEDFPEIFSSAQLKVDSCPFNMGGEANLPLIYTLGRLPGMRHVLETGVAFGWSSLTLLLALTYQNEGLLYSTDMPYPNRNNDEWVGCAVPKELRRSWTLLRGADRWGIPKALRILRPLDLCHYDSDKRYEGRVWAYRRIWRALRPGGLLISDDISDNFAFRDFARQIGMDPIIVCYNDKYQGILKKPA